MGNILLTCLTSLIVFLPTELPAAHNNYHSLHGVPPVTWSKQIVARAQSHADSCLSKHSTSGYGENIAWATNDKSPATIVEMWYGEESLYDYNFPGYSPGIGHFTQIIWKNTTKIGCASQQNAKPAGQK